MLDGSAGDKLLATQHFPPAKPDPVTAMRTLLNGGWGAVLDFVVGLPGLMRMQARADRHHASSLAPAGPERR